MIKLIKASLLVFLSISVIIACDPDPAHEGDRDDAIQDERVEEGMQQFWREEREKFVEGADFQIQEHERTLQEMEESERVIELQAELDYARERLSEIEEEEEHEWENTRDEIANVLIYVRREIEELT